MHTNLTSKNSSFQKNKKIQTHKKAGTLLEFFPKKLKLCPSKTRHQISSPNPTKQPKLFTIPPSPTQRNIPTAKQALSNLCYNFSWQT